MMSISEEIFTAIISSISAIGAIIGAEGKEDIVKYSQMIFCFTNAVWSIYFLFSKQYGVAVQFIAFLIISIRGVYKWMK